MHLTKHCQIKKWLVLYFTSKKNNSGISKYLNMDILTYFKIQLSYIQLPNNYYIKIILNYNLPTLLHQELDYYTIFVNVNDKNDLIIQQDDIYIRKQLNNVLGKYGENMKSNYQINRDNKELKILVPSRDNYILSIRDYNKTTRLNSKLINDMEIIYLFYDSKQQPFMRLAYQLNSPSDKMNKPDGIYRFEYTTQLSYTNFDMKLIYLTIPYKIKLY